MLLFAQCGGDSDVETDDEVAEAPFMFVYWEALAA